jgi:pyruvate/oxaloacetate carboxyltransferase
LEIKIESLETELRESEVEANEVISQWQNNCAAAESKYASIEEELNNLKAATQTHKIPSGAKDADQMNYRTMVEKLSQKEEELRRVKEEASPDSDTLQELKGTLFISSSPCFFTQFRIS